MTTPTDTSRAPAVRFGMGYYTATTCPAIVGNLLVYRNIAHMEPAWSRFISPVLADAIVPVMPGAG